MKKLAANKEAQDLREKLGIDAKEYSSEKAINDLSEFLEQATSFTTTLLIFLLPSVLIFLSISVGYAVMHKTYLFPVLFFIAALPVIAGVGAIGFKRGLEDTLSGINGIINYGLNLTEEIYNLSKKNSESKVSLSEVGRFVGYHIVIPAVGVWAKTKFLGGIVYNLTCKGFGKIYRLLDKEEKNIEEVEIDEIKLQRIKSVISGTNSISKTLVDSVRLLSSVISIVGIILGGIFITIVVIVNGVL